jgi:Zn-finger nucleic acid-binding protein
MVVVGYEDVELDYCTECHGVWFDAGELEQLFETMHLEPGVLRGDTPLNLPEAKTAEQPRRCPICGHRMKKVNIGQPPILIDACGNGHGLWFDKGEVSQLAAHFRRKRSTSEEQVICFLGEVLKADNQPD